MNECLNILNNWNKQKEQYMTTYELSPCEVPTVELIVM